MVSLFVPKCPLPLAAFHLARARATRRLSAASRTLACIPCNRRTLPSVTIRLSSELLSVEQITIGETLMTFLLFDSPFAQPREGEASRWRVVNDGQVGGVRRGPSARAKCPSRFTGARKLKEGELAHYLSIFKRNCKLSFDHMPTD